MMPQKKNSPQAPPQAETQTTPLPNAPQTETQQSPPNALQAPPQAEPHITEQTVPQADAHTPQQTSRPQTAPANWYTDTLRTIVNRALDADKPDIKGALAALAMLAEAEDPAEDTEGIATLLRNARKRAAHAKENTD